MLDLITVTEQDIARWKALAYATTLEQLEEYPEHFKPVVDACKLKVGTVLSGVAFEEIEFNYDIAQSIML